MRDKSMLLNDVSVSHCSFWGFLWDFDVPSFSACRGFASKHRWETSVSRIPRLYTPT